MRRSARLLFALALASGATLAACGGDDSGDPGGSVAPDAPAGDVTGDITVFAASSLTAAYEEIGDAFMDEHPDADVVLNFGASSSLVAQILEGAPADVYASADEANMGRLTDADGAAGPPQTFATNRLQIIVEAGNPLDITGLEDLTDPDLLFVTCAPEVPIGGYTQQVLDAAGVDVTPVSLEQNVKGIVTKVTLGEADAGIVYQTDVTAAGDAADGVDIPADVNVTAAYPIATTVEAGNPDGAAAFVDFVLGDEGQEILAAYGFGSAETPVGEPAG